MLHEISRVAAALFFEKGYMQTTTKEIAESCGISVGTLYYYIESKSDFLTMFSNIHREDIEQWERAIRKEMNVLSPEEVLRKAVRELAYLIDKRQDIVLFWYYTKKYLTAKQLRTISLVEKRIVTLFKEIIELGHEQGRLTAGDPLVSAINVSMLCFTWALQRWLLKDRYTIEQYAGLCQDMAVSMVGGCADPSTS